MLETESPNDRAPQRRDPRDERTPLLKRCEIRLQLGCHYRGIACCRHCHRVDEDEEEAETDEQTDHRGDESPKRNGERGHHAVLTAENPRADME